MDVDRAVAAARAAFPAWSVPAANRRIVIEDRHASFIRQTCIIKMNIDSLFIKAYSPPQVAISQSEAKQLETAGGLHRTKRTSAASGNRTALCR
ncbi:hypothetical protein [Cupriavidus necator]|uniref:hypothetical protein n=1 Tax=Cupriavidus necator TaxID=106590 RepID=UPI003F502160